MGDNHRIKNIYYMLSYAYKSLQEKGSDDIAAEDFDSVHDLLAAILVHGVTAQVKRGLYRDYVQQEEALAGLRGRIALAESIKQRTIPQGKLVCDYDEFTEDSPHNQVVKTTMLLLLRLGDVKDANRTALRKLLAYFGNVTEVVPSQIRWDGLNYHRNNASYRMLIGICRLVIDGLLLTTQSGRRRLTSWLDDDKMSHLYEKFVLSYYQQHHPDLAPTAAYVSWDLRSIADETYLPTMKTDITLSRGDKRLIIDTKYYGHTMQVNSHFDSMSFISSNLYQIFAYVKNSDREASGDVAGVLLYAKTDEDVTPDEVFNIGGNMICLRTLDLDQEWKGITYQLEKLCEWLKE